MNQELFNIAVGIAGAGSGTTTSVRIWVGSVESIRVDGGAVCVTIVR